MQLSGSCFPALPGREPVHADPTIHHLPCTSAVTTLYAHEAFSPLPVLKKWTGLCYHVHMSTHVPVPSANQCKSWYEHDRS